MCISKVHFFCFSFINFSGHNGKDQLKKKIHSRKILLFPMSSMFIQLVTISLRLTTKLTCPLHEIKSMFSLYRCKTKVRFLILCVCIGLPRREKKTLKGNWFQNLDSLSYILSIFMFIYISYYNFGYLEFKFSLLIFCVRSLCSENVLCIISAPKFYQ